MEHLALEMTGHVPGLLPAHGGIEGENQPSGAGHTARFRGRHFSEKSVDIRMSWIDFAVATRSRLVFGHGGLLWASKLRGAAVRPLISQAFPAALLHGVRGV